MTIQQFIQTHDLDHSVLLGYYGGGNYGDELLLEVLAFLLTTNGTQNISVAYQDMTRLNTYHHDFGYATFSMYDKRQLFQAIIKNKNIVVGGGGLWGMDVNRNIFLLSALLLLARRVLGKKVYLLGVGYYNSTSKLGRIGAWLAGKAANFIICRDEETHENFRLITNQVSLDHDLAWQLRSIDTSRWDSDLQQLEERLTISSKTLFITLRHFKPSHHNNYVSQIENCLAQNTDKPILIALMEPARVDPQGFRRIMQWQKKYKNVRAFDFSYNPVALYMFFKRHAERLVLIAPQFHAIITAQLTGVPFLPIAYDNKVSQLLQKYNSTAIIPLKELSQTHLQHFINEQFARGAHGA